ncbi:MAG: biopolymer transporter ExbD [Deltaproteobacteria bacterium]|nr:biopolymer transporter ExbD [Deltaproteobacteria bacterium]
MPHFTAAQRRRIRRATRIEEPPPGDDELNIVPFLDVVVNLIMFLLLTMTASLAAREVHAQLPTTDPSPARGEPVFRPTIVLTEGGVFVSSAAGHHGPGCEAGGEGPAVRIVGGEPDWLALRACAERMKAAHPDAHSATLTADPGIEVQWLIAAMDAVRGPGDSLFDDIALAAGIR